METREEILNAMIGRLAQLLNRVPSELTEATEFESLNLKSVNYSQLTTYLEDQCDVEVPYMRPTSEELADIAIASSTTVKRLLNWEPRIAMLSFSTKGSSAHADVDKMMAAVDLVRRKRPDLKVDGEFQLDAAILPQAAARKVPGESPVAGRANILVFPDLGAGNIGVKLLQIFGHAAPLDLSASVAVRLGDRSNHSGTAGLVRHRYFTGADRRVHAYGRLVRGLGCGRLPETAVQKGPVTPWTRFPASYWTSRCGS